MCFGSVLYISLDGQFRLLDFAGILVLMFKVVLHEGMMEIP